MGSFQVVRPKAAYRRAYKDGDIRGVYPTEIDEQTTYLTGRAFVDEFGYKTVVVGSDVRLSTPALKAAFVEGVRAAGATVVDIGLVTSPMLYFASGSLELPGAMITASHSPREYNGIKLVAPGAVPLTRRAGLAAVRRHLDEMDFKMPTRRGRLIKKSINRAYQKFVLRGVARRNVANVTVAADLGNGMAGVLLPLIDGALPATFHAIYETLDGRFPNRDLDPCLTENQRALRKLIKDTHADFGIGFDGDADRIAFLDEKGRYVNCAAIGALIAARLLARQPGAGIVYTNLTSRILPETIVAAGGRPLCARVGHAFLKQKLREEDAIFGAEHSGHFFFKAFFNTDSAVLTLLAVLDAYADAKRAGQTFSAMLAPYTVYQQTEDVVVHVADKPRALALMHKKILSLKPVSVKKFDGYVVDFGDVWGAVKASVTEPAIKLMFESKDRTKAEAVQTELLTYLESIAKET